MKLAEMKTDFNGRKKLYLFGKKVFSYKKMSEYDKIYAKRYDGLTSEELAVCIKKQFEKALGYELNLDNPQTFNEKLNWCKLYYHNPLMTICADKVKGRDYFLQKTADDGSHLVRQLGVYSSVDEIDLAKLPSKFVLKSNWGSGLQIIVADKNSFDFEAAKEKMTKWLDIHSNHYYMAFEYGYKHIEPKIVCEEFLEFEYKLEFFCFNGKAQFFWVVFDDKTEKVHADFYTLDWQKMPVRHKYLNSDVVLPRPSYFDEMLKTAEKLCGDFPFVRCDFYKTADSWRFSEMTFYHWAALQKFSPEKYDFEFGKMIQLPEKMVEGE